jgi:hypothetical protein
LLLAPKNIVVLFFILYFFSLNWIYIVMLE